MVWAKKLRWLAAAFVLLANSIVAAPGDELWSFETGDQIFGSPTVDRNGNVYFGSRDNFVYALTGEGELRWSFEAGDWVDSSPTLSFDEKTLYFGSWDNKMYAVSAESGALQWSFEAKNLIVASPSLDAQGNLFFGASDGFFYSLTAQGELRWFYFVGEEMDSSPAIDGSGNVYVGAFDGQLYSFSNTGELRWSYATGLDVEEGDRRIKSPPTIGENEAVYVGGGDGRLYALTLDGQLLWQFQAPEKVDTGIAVREDGSLIFGSRDGFVYALDENGVYLWESYVGDIFYSTPAVDRDGGVYVGSYVGNGVSGISALSESGELVWESLVLGYIDSSPLLSGEGRLYYGSYDGAFRAIEADVQPAMSVWNRFGAGRANQSLFIDFLLSQDFEAWLAEEGLESYKANPYSDLDGDGFTLFEEYYFGGKPSLPDASLLAFQWTGTDLQLQFVRLDQAVSPYVFHLEMSNDLRAWMPVEAVTEVMLEESVAGESRYDKVQLVLPQGASGSVFYRLRVF